MNSTFRNSIIAHLVGSSAVVQEKSASLNSAQADVVEACLPEPQDLPTVKVAKLLAIADEIQD